MPQMHLFIDTNVLLNYYRHTADDTKALDGLCEHVKVGNIVLHLPLQVKNEWIRNRERSLFESTEAFRKVSLPGLPRHLHGLDSTPKYLEAVKALSIARDQLLIEANSKALQFDLEVDKSLSHVFEVGWILSDSDVRDFYLWLLESFTQTLDPGVFDALVDALGLSPDPEDNDPWADA